MPGTHILATADDLTGAVETGAKFAARGFRVTVTLWPDTAGETGDAECDVMVMDTETRHLSAEDAAARIGSLAARALSPQIELFYHKTDSTLRGNIGPELRAVAGVFAGRGVEYAPAYPSLGRTVARGRLLIHSVPAHQTEFARDPLDPIRTNDVRGIVGEHPAIRIHDGETEQDVAVVARLILAASPRPAACGPACLAGHLAAQLRPAHRENAGWPKTDNCLVISGSAHPRSIQQIGNAPGHWPVLTSAAGAAETVRRLRPEVLILFGGDTSYSVLRELGIAALTPIGEILPGVPFSRIGNGQPPQYAITKAGGFGSIDLLDQLRRLLT